MIVNGVDLSKVSTLLADFEQQARGKRRESDVSLFDVYPGLTERNERIGARIGIDDGLHTHFGFVHLQRRRRRNVVAASRANEIADQADVRIEEFGVARRASESLCLRDLSGWLRSG